MKAKLISASFIILALTLLGGCGYSDLEDCLENELSGETNKTAAQLKAAKCYKEFSKPKIKPTNVPRDSLLSQCVQSHLGAHIANRLRLKRDKSGYKAFTNTELLMVYNAEEACGWHNN